MKQFITILILLQPLVFSIPQNSPKREMRGVWIATVENIDWPSVSGLPVKQQQKELTELLELTSDYHLNTIILQIRPAADAFYASFCKVF